jgi:translation initiation factor 2 beta subunit (eIF-2beta)/eIF-5
MNLTKNHKIILISVIVIIVLTILYFIFFKNKGLLNKNIGDLQPETQPKIFAINSVDDFINAAKYLRNNKPFGYSLIALEAKKDYLNSIEVNKLKEIYNLLQDISKNSEEDNENLLKFLQKTFS